MREVNARQNDSNRPLSPQDPGGSGTPPQTEEPPSGLEKLRCALLGTELDRPHADHLTAVDPRAPHRDGYVVWPPRPESLGISCSGGGIRSASYNLGALQQLRGAGLLGNPASGGADYLAAVSGGAYTAVAHTITAGFSEDSVFDTLPPWAAGSPEEQRLRNHADYLAPGFWGKVWALMNAAVGLGMNLLPFLLVLVMVGNLLGWSYWKLADPQLGPPDGQPDPLLPCLPNIAGGSCPRCWLPASCCSISARCWTSSVPSRRGCCSSSSIGRRSCSSSAPLPSRSCMSSRRSSSQVGA